MEDFASGGRIPLVYPSQLDDMQVRWEHTGRYSFAVVTEEALAAIAEASPRGAVEEAAGGGYLAALLRDRGVRVEAFDLEPSPRPESMSGSAGYETGGNVYISHSWGGVKRAAAGVSAQYPDLTLVLCWPPEQEPAARVALESYLGETLVFIGELPDGLDRPSHMADEQFFELLRTEWRKVREVAIPQWRVPDDGEHDTLSVWQRAHLRS